MRSKICLFLLLSLIISGCAYSPHLTERKITEINVLCNDNALCIINEINEAQEQLRIQRKEERLIKRLRNAERWEDCKLAYRTLGHPYVSKHAHLRWKKHRAWEVKEDLFENGCRSILKRLELWE